MNLPEYKLREYYEGVAESLIEDGIEGWTKDELVEKLMSDPDNPFRPLSNNEILQMLEKSDRQYREGKYKNAEEVIEELRQKHGFSKNPKNGG